MRTFNYCLLSFVFTFIVFAADASAQITAITYQGRLTDSSMSPSGVYDFRFQLYNNFGVPAGSAITVEDVQVTNGIFTVQLDFGSTAFSQSGFTSRTIEIAVRPGNSTGSFTALAPRQVLAAAPFAVAALKSETATTATIANNANALGGTAASQFVQTTDSRLSDARPPTADSNDYIQNGSRLQSPANFNISGNGTIGGSLQAFDLNATNDLSVQGNANIQGAIQGNGSNLTSLNAANITTGTLNAARVPNLDAGKITTGTFADARLSANVPRLNATNTFAANQTINGTLSANAVSVPNNATITAAQTSFGGANGLLVSGTFGSGAIPATGVGTRLMFYPGKAAFRAGFINGTQWENANVGNYSFGVGYNAIASGEYSAALNIGTTASGTASTAMGYLTEATNTAATAIGYITKATGNSSTAIGSFSTASGGGSVAIGNNLLASGFGAIAMGTYASTNLKAGSFVFGDDSGSETNIVTANVANEFVARASGGFRFRTASDLSTGCNLPAGSGTFTCTSSRTLKTNFLAVDGADTLARLRRVPVQTYRYLNEPNAVRHLGAFAEDFYREFRLGTDEKSIGLLDIAGVNTAAIKELDRQILTLQGENRKLLEQTDWQREQLQLQQRQIDALKKIVCAASQNADICKPE